jgi:hypothetical protein
MPLVDLDPGGGQSDTVPVVFTDGPMVGNNQWIIEWRILPNRFLFQVSAQGQTHIYKAVSIDDNVQVVADYQETL